MRAESGDIHCEAFGQGGGGGGERMTEGAGDLLLRVATLVREIEALKRERHSDAQWSTRLELASVYFRKRRERPSGPAPERTASAA